MQKAHAIGPSTHYCDPALIYIADTVTDVHCIRGKIKNKK